ncbi:MAG: substrate-binding domain-containing protein [Anaerolineae bacterium]|nr:substrate-binding domain-containing protein [Anaerolineae bacterium]
MKNYWRTIAATGLMALLLTVGAAFARTQDTPRLAGSSAAAPLIKAIVDSIEPSFSLTIEVTGTSRGLNEFCSGLAAAVAATRPISTEEEAACQAAGISYQEYLLGHSILAFVINSLNNPTSCLTNTQLNSLLAPSATSQTAWSSVDSTLTLPLTVFLPPSDTLLYAQIDALVRGDGLRPDARSTDMVAQKVAETEGALGILSLLEAQERPELVILSYNAEGENSACIGPSAEAVEANQYTAASSLYLYVSTAQSQALRPLVQALTNPEIASIIAQAGFTPPSLDAFLLNEQVAQSEAEGRQFSQVEDFRLPEKIVGTVVFGGDGATFPIVNSVTTNLKTAHPDLTTTMRFEGEAAGVRRLCNNEANFVVFTSAPLNDDQQLACQATDVQPVTLQLSQRAVVMLANSADSYAQCLTTEQVRTIWSAVSSVDNWQQLGETFPDAPMLLFAPPEGSPLADLLFMGGGGPVLPIREVTENNADPLYRAAAVANVRGSLTFMSWLDYLRVLANNQERIQVVAVDDGAGCVLPSEASITSAEYPLSQAAYMIVSQASLRDVAVQSVIWSLFSDDNVSLWQANAFLGPNFMSAAALREQLLIEFALAAETAQAEAVTFSEAETTPQPEATPDAEATPSD